MQNGMRKKKMKYSDDLGDRMKAYEKVYTIAKLDPEAFVCVRLDGRGFSKFTKGMNRPYDLTMSNLMMNTTKEIMTKSNAKVAYTQSDEITLIFDKPTYFDGKIQKTCSVLAAQTTAIFNYHLSQIEEYGYRTEMFPHFDARAFSLPSASEAANSVIWRMQDARKNSISMAASTHFSHKKLQGKSSGERIDMLAEIGIPYDAYPDFFKNGTFYYKKLVVVTIPDEIWQKIPVNKRVNRTTLRNVFMNIDYELHHASILKLLETL